MAKTRRRFASGSGKFYEPQTGCTRGKRIRLVVLEDEEEVYYGEPQMVFCGRTWLHGHPSNQQETEEDLEDEEHESCPKKQKLEQRTDEREKEAAVCYPDDANMESLLTWLHATDMESCGPISELAKLKAEGKIESGYKTLEKICAPLISEFDSVYAEIDVDVDVETLYNQESPLQDEIVIPPAESISERPLSPILNFIDWNREFPDQGGIESDYNTLEEICTPEVDASLNEWLSSLTSPLHDEIAMPQIEIKSKRRFLSCAKSGNI